MTNTVVLEGYITPAQAQEICGVNQETLRTWYRKGILPGVMVDGRYFFLEEDIRKLGKDKLNPITSVTASPFFNTVINEKKPNAGRTVYDNDELLDMCKQRVIEKWNRSGIPYGYAEWYFAMLLEGDWRVERSAVMTRGEWESIKYPKSVE